MLYENSAMHVLMCDTHRNYIANCVLKTASAFNMSLLPFIVCVCVAMLARSTVCMCDWMNIVCFFIYFFFDVVLCYKMICCFGNAFHVFIWCNSVERVLTHHTFSFRFFPRFFFSHSHWLLLGFIFTHIHWRLYLGRRTIPHCSSIMHTVEVLCVPSTN